MYCLRWKKGVRYRAYALRLGSRVSVFRFFTRGFSWDIFSDKEGGVLRLFLLVFHLLVTLLMIGVILLQKGEDVGSGSSKGGFFSARGAKNGLTMTTAILATLFFVNCIALALVVQKEARLTGSSDSKSSLPTPAVPASKPIDVPLGLPLQEP